MQVQCPSCGKTLKAPDSAAGRVVKCPACGGQMQLPAAEVAPAAPEVLANAGAETAPVRPSARRPGSAPPKLNRPSTSDGLGAPSPAGMSPGKVKNCRFCGEEILSTATRCKHCKSNLAGSAVRTMQQHQKKTASADGNKALVMGILCFFCLGPILAPMAIYFGSRARKGGDGKGTVGMILGIVYLSLLVLGIVAFALLGQGRGD